jgi:hypothetical protein
VPAHFIVAVQIKSRILHKCKSLKTLIIIPVSINFSFTTLIINTCSGQKMPESWGRLSEALGNWRSGNLEGGGFGERVRTREVSLQATLDRGGRILSQLGGFQVSRRGLERGTKGNQQGEKKARGMRHVY